MQFEHLIDGKKPDALAVFAMFASSLSQTKTRVEECFRVVGTQTCVDPSEISRTPTSLLSLDVMNE